MNFLAVAWDIDGTLVDSEPLHHRALLAGCRQFGIDLSDLPAEAYRGVHMGDVWLALRHRLPPTLRKDEWLAAIESCYVENCADLSPMPGSIETVRALRGIGVPQACVSNSARSIVDANLDALGIGDCIAFSISFDDVLAGKPDPQPYIDACRRLAVAPPQILAVEDSHTGAMSARAAGLAVAGYGSATWAPGEIDIGTSNLSDLLRLFQSPLL